MKPDLRIADYTYDLPEDRIAKYPLAQRDGSKLLHYSNGITSDHNFSEVVDLLPADTLLVFNNTKVVQARLLFEKTPGARPIEIFCLEPVDLDVQQAMATQNNLDFECLVGNAKRWTAGLELTLELQQDVDLRARMHSRKYDTIHIHFAWNGDFTFAEVLEMAGKMPLPPYLKRDSEAADKERYQTVYARFDGSVAAPTAGLHFTDYIFQQFDKKGIKRLETTLHVGAGTFKPVTSALVRDHEMHAEEIHVKRELLEALINHRGQIIAVGTTSTRTLESLYWMGVKVIAGKHQSDEHFKLGQWESYELPQQYTFSEALTALLQFLKEKGLETLLTYTSLIIAPGYKFRVLDGLFTNFHQPGSTLILLVAAALGDDWKKVYTHALAKNYRFLSYGDSNLYLINPEDKIVRS